jgi:hypothetical protein
MNQPRGGQFVARFFMSDYKPIEPLVLTIAETCRVESKGRSAIYEGIIRGEYEAVKDGARTLITYESIKRRHASLPRVGRDVPMIQSPSLAKGTAKRKSKTAEAASSTSP